VDNLATVVGGRNIGDEYFGATEGVLFVDVDVLAVGAVVPEVSRDFDRYWASESAYPAERVLPRADADDLAELAESAELAERDAAAAAYVEALRDTRIVQALFESSLALEWATAQMISDDPAKGLGKAAPGGLLLQKLRPVIGNPAASMDLVSPYFVPGVIGTDWFASLAAHGVKVRILTNAQEATDVAPVHAGYVKRRKDLLKAGVTLYEMQRQTTASKKTKERGRFGSSSGSSLHAKTFAVDQSRAFIGSFNFDPRSAELNTEMGFVIDSPTLAGRIAKTFDTIVPNEAYEVRLTASGQLNWIERDAGKEVLHETEPGTNLLQRGFVQFMTLLPIDWLL
jgi:putative cardiolipin synthase